jgi:hypothetical protein
LLNFSWNALLKTFHVTTDSKQRMKGTVMYVNWWREGVAGIRHSPLKNQNNLSLKTTKYNQFSYVWQFYVLWSHPRYWIEKYWVTAHGEHTGLDFCESLITFLSTYQHTILFMS